MRSVELVEPEIHLFDDAFGEPDYQATTLDACFEGDLYDTRSYDVSGVPVDLDELRATLRNQGWEMSEGIQPFPGSSLLIRGSTRRNSDAIHIHVVTHGSPATSLSVDLMFRSVAADLCKPPDAGAELPLGRTESCRGRFKLARQRT